MRLRSLFSAVLILSLLATSACRGFQRQSDEIVGFNPSGWNLLGERRASFARESDAIHVTLAKGRYRRLSFVVRDSALEMYDVVVTFSNGEVFTPVTRMHFGEDTRSRAIDLPGARRAIRKVEFRYRSRNVFTGFAEIELWGK